MNSKKKLGPSFQKKVNYYLDKISDEHIDIQEELALLLPAKVQLAKLHVNSMEELALLPYAKEQGLPYSSVVFDYSKVKPPCPYCGEMSKITKAKKNTYLCNVCNKKYTPNKDSIMSGSNLDAITWMQTLLCLLEGYTIDRTCNYCKYTSETYYNVRNRIFYAMKLFMDEVKLYGLVQCDNTEVRISFKGQNLIDNDYPEDSPFYIEDFVPRVPRERGGAYKKSELNMNKIPVFTAVDSYGHVLARQAGIGATTYTTLNDAVGKDKILLSVPDEDPFKYQKPIKVKENDDKKEAEQKITETLLISDGELSIKKYAEKAGIKHEAHVFRRDNKQLKLSKGSYNIQKVNYIHKELKNFLRKVNISTKYLPGYLTLFEFKMNTGASDKAIEHLFEILVRPGLGKSADFYKSLFTVPNYIVEWGKKDSPLTKFPYNQLYSTYLYYKKKMDNDSDITMKEIAEETGYSETSIRRIYKNFAASGLIDAIVEHFEGEKPKKKNNWPPELIEMLKEYSLNCSLPYNKRKTAQAFLDEANAKYNTSYKKANFLNYVSQSKKLNLGIDYVPIRSKKANGRRYSDSAIEKGYKIHQRFDEIQQAARANNITLKKKDIYRQIAKEYGVTQRTVQNLYYYINQIKNEG